MSRISRRAVAVAAVGAFAVAPMVTACAAGKHPQTALPTQLAEGVNASAHLVDIRNAFLLGPDPGGNLAAHGAAPLYVWFVNHAATPDKLVAVEAPDVAGSVEIAGGGVVLPPGKLIATVQKPGAQPPAPTNPPNTSTPGRGTPTPGKSTPGKSTAGKSTPPRHPLAASTTPAPSAATAPGAVATATPLPAQTPSGPPVTSPGQNGSSVVLRDLVKPLSGGENLRLTLHFQQAGVVTLNVPVVMRSGYYATYAPVAVPPVAPPAAQPGQPGKTPGTTAPGTTVTPTPKKAKAKKSGSPATA